MAADVTAAASWGKPESSSVCDSFFSAEHTILGIRRAGRPETGLAEDLRPVGVARGFCKKQVVATAEVEATAAMAKRWDATPVQARGRRDAGVD